MNSYRLNKKAFCFTTGIGKGDGMFPFLFIDILYLFKIEKQWRLKNKILVNMENCDMISPLVLLLNPDNSEE